LIINKQLISQRLIFGSQVIAVILTVFLHHGNGRAITSTNNNNIERMFDFVAEEELNTILNETNENPTDREENPADVLRLSEPDSLSYESLQSQFSKDNVIQPKEAGPALRQKKFYDEHCYSGKYETVKLASGEVKKFPICKKVTLIGCTSLISSNKYNKRSCVASLTTILFSGDDGTNQLGVFAKSCECAA